jgi:hypothetical protein
MECCTMVGRVRLYEGEMRNANCKWGILFFALVMGNGVR